MYGTHLRTREKDSLKKEEKQGPHFLQAAPYSITDIKKEGEMRSEETWGVWEWVGYREAQHLKSLSRPEI